MKGAYRITKELDLPKLDGAKCAEIAGRRKKWEQYGYWWTSDNAYFMKRAKEVCQECPVQRECLQWAMQHGEDFGVWGGYDPLERRALRRARIAIRDGHSRT